MEELIRVLGRVSQRVSSLTIEHLLGVCGRLKIDPGDAAEKENGRLQLIRKILRHLNDEDSEEGDLEGLQLLETFIDEMAPPTMPANPGQAPRDPAPAQRVTPATACAGEGSDLQPDSTMATAPNYPIMSADALSLVRRDFKISGQIGEPGQKDRLTFSSLAHQIESGLEKGHHDREIVQGVIRAIAPGSSLRSYLEGRRQVTLASLRRILRCHYQEQDATELYKQLAQLAQEQKETSQAFLLRALDLRQKVIFASQEADSLLRYEPGLVQQMFRHSVLTGLRSDAIRMELRQHLEDPDLTDESLFEKLNACSSIEAERRKKLHLGKSATASSVQASSDKASPKQGLLLTEISSLKSGIADLSALKDQVAALQASLNDSTRRAPTSAGPRTRVKRGCRDCQQHNRGETCDHCFRCGSTEHFARGCRQARPTRQGNEGGLPPRDRE